MDETSLENNFLYLVMDGQYPKGNTYLHSLIMEMSQKLEFLCFFFNCQNPLWITFVRKFSNLFND